MEIQIRECTSGSGIEQSACACKLCSIPLEITLAPKFLFPTQITTSSLLQERTPTGTSELQTIPYWEPFTLLSRKKLTFLTTILVISGFLKAVFLSELIKEKLCFVSRLESIKCFYLKVLAKALISCAWRPFLRVSFAVETKDNLWYSRNTTSLKYSTLVLNYLCNQVKVPVPLKNKNATSNS